MQLTTSTGLGASILAAISLIQPCPAPVAIPALGALASGTIAAGASGAVAGGVSGAIAASKDKRQGRGQERERVRRADPPAAPQGVPQEEFDRCFNDLAGVNVNVQGPVQNNGVQMDNLPASCMNLATVIDGDAAGGPTPTPCGSACLLYDNLSPEDFDQMKTVFDDAPKAP
ncbi:hypothetical protein F4779DRAFT_643410 [Xylariaceae sp. FL0662B]|nr:hypothetical protein F4779DRAFT_643410 [Xylariaceae sp. FL0662B]